MASKKYEVTADALNIREEPSTHGRIIDWVAKGDQVELISMEGDNYWYKVRTSRGTVGWASHKYLKPVLAAHGEFPHGEFPWLAIASAEMGQHELAGAGRNNPRIVEYLHSTNLGAPSWDQDETLWCSAFVNWCFEKAGYAGTDSAAAKSWLHWGKAVNVPVRGCVAVFTRGGSRGHVGFYMGEDASSISVLGGNQSDAVNVSPREKSKLLGYRMPGTT